MIPLDQQFAHIPIIFRLKNKEEKMKYDELINKQKVDCLDTIQSQLRELIKLRNPAKQLTEEEYTAKISQLLNTTPIQEYGVWVYYPWKNCIVHTLDEPEFIEVRTSRNLYKITIEERDMLASKTIGVVGLSVGQSIAITMAIERTCGHMRLADFDILELSNLNRIRSGLNNLGLPKVIITAREIAEIDPFIKLELFYEGLTEKNRQEFFGKGDQKLDVLIEVCDGIDTKISSRIQARELGIPVIMDTNDKGMIDIERFDLEPKRPIFHGMFDETIDISKLDANARLKVLMQIIPFEHLSERLKISMSEIGKSITTWPQLASSVTIGGGVTTELVRKILLNQHQLSGRFYFDIDAMT